MRLWLTEEEQNNINKQFYGNVRYDHVHVVYYRNEYKKEFDLCGNTDISYLKYSDFKYVSNASFKSWTYEQIMEILPSVIYCDDEYNIVDPAENKFCRKLQLHVIKRRDENKDIDYKYSVSYKPISAPNVRKRIFIKDYDYKDPVIESDDIMECLYRMLLWCMSKGHVMTKERHDYLEKLEKQKQKRLKKSEVLSLSDDGPE